MFDITAKLSLQKMKRLLVIICLLTTLSFYSCRKDSNSYGNEDSSSIVIEIPKSEIDLAGIWKSKDNPFYPILEFKGKSTVLIKTIMGPFATSYERDEEFIRVRTDQSDLLFEVISEDSIIGSGYAEGLWVKE